MVFLSIFLAAAPVTANELRAHTEFLASDLLEGRGPATRGDQLAQQYIATQFRALGLTTTIQPFDIVGVDGHPDSVTFKTPKTSMTLPYRDDVIAISGHQELVSELRDAELLFVGYGITAPEFKWDDFKGVDVKGKVLVVMNNDPEDDPKLFGGKARLWYGRWDYKYEKARELGAAGVFIIHTTPSAGYPWQVVQTSWSGEQFDLPYGPGHQLQLKGWLSEGAARKLFALTGKNLDALRSKAQTRGFKPVPLGVTISTRFESKVARKTTANVLGVLPGTDPALKSEFVVYTAHHDHLGIGDPDDTGDTIYNGAVDNAAGVAALLTAARVISSQPPKRSVLFAAVAAEEQGLLGSQFLIEHSPVPPAKMAVDINVDGLNILGRTSDLSVVGLGKSNIDAMIVELARKQGRTVHSDALSDRGFFYRSDQFNFAKRGVPSAYFSSGQDFIGKPEGWGQKQRETWEEKRYHQPSDEVTKEWDLSGAVEDVQLYIELGLAIGNSSTLPAWVKGDEFEAERLRSFGAK